MYTSEVKIRVLYADTDKMGFVYYGNYPKYYEYGRTEAIRETGISYKKIEEMGVAMPVIDLHVSYKKPAFYDDLLTIKTTIEQLPDTRMHFTYEITNQHNEILNVGETTLIFLDLSKNRPIKAPEYVLNKLKPYFETC